MEHLGLFVVARQSFGRVDCEGDKVLLVLVQSLRGKLNGLPLTTVVQLESERIVRVVLAHRRGPGFATPQGRGRAAGPMRQSVIAPVVDFGKNEVLVRF